MGVVCPGKFNNIIEPSKMYKENHLNGVEFKKMRFVKNGKMRDIPRIENLSLYNTRKKFRNFILRKEKCFVLSSEKKSKSLSDLANKALDMTKIKNKL